MKRRYSLWFEGMLTVEANSQAEAKQNTRRWATAMNDPFGNPKGIERECRISVETSMPKLPKIPKDPKAQSARQQE